MSLPTGQQRVLNRMEGALRASEPRLTMMYDTFARLSAGEPVTREKLSAWRLRWLRSGSTIYAVVLIPVMFVVVIIGSLLGGTARGAATCDVGYSAGGGPPLNGRASCPSGNQPAAGDTAARDAGAPCPAASGNASQPGASQPGASQPGASQPGAHLDGAAGQDSEPASRYVSLTGGEQGFSPPVRASSAAAGTPPGVC
jgi:hypothetical protein